MERKIVGLIFLLLAGVSFSASAVDGDVVYSAPYIWVNPETGEIETVNPGPQLKNHEQVPASPIANQVSMESGMDAEVQAGPAAADAEAVAHTSLLHPIIVLIGMALSIGVITVMGKRAG